MTMLQKFNVTEEEPFNCWRTNLVADIENSISPE
jgi:hypothetical protein